MSTSKQVIVYIGLFLGLGVFLILVWMFILFIVPGKEIMGVTAVVTRQVYTTYTAEEIPGIDDVLAHRNIIIESDYIDVEVRVRKAGQQDAGSIQVWEHSTGISFNSIHRTHIEWSQVMVERKDSAGKIFGEVFYLIKIVEPKGIISRDGNVFINMSATEGNSNEQQPFNFILNTGRSNVTFASDNDSIVYANPLKVGTLEIRNSYGVISLPAPPSGMGEDEADKFHVNIGDVIVDTRTVTLKCLSPVRNNVSIKCNLGAFTFGRIGGNINIQGDVNDFSVNHVGGDIKVVGKQVRFTQTKGDINGSIKGGIDFQVPNGHLTVFECATVYMRTVNAYLRVTGMATALDFEATGIGQVNVAQVGNESSLHSSDRVRVVTVAGSVSIYKAWVNTFIESTNGHILIDFASDIPLNTGLEPTLTVRAYDGSVDARNICGAVDIYARPNGLANITAEFRQVRGGSIVYEGSTNPNRNKGNMKITFIKNIAYCVFNINRTASAINRTKTTTPMLTTLHGNVDVAEGGSLVNGDSYQVNRNVAGGSVVSSGNLTVSTSNKLEIFSR